MLLSNYKHFNFQIFGANDKLIESQKDVIYSLK